MSKRILIIGGGISGLSAGVYGRMAGFETEIVEQHTIPGGECTGWDREGFHIDGCIRWLTGTLEGSPVYKVWEDLGALENGVGIYRPEYLYEAEYDGTVVRIYRDLDRLRSHLLEISPEDRDEIEYLFEQVELVGIGGIPLSTPESMRGQMTVMKNLPMSISEYLSRFRHPAIRFAFSCGFPGQYSAYTLPFTLGIFVKSNMDRPFGGSRAMAERIADKFLSLGGKLHLGRKAESIIINGGRAEGVKMCDGEVITADYVVPSVDIHITIDKLLMGKYKVKQIEERDARPDIYPLLRSVYTAFAVDDPLEDVPESYCFPVEPFPYEDRSVDRIWMQHFGYEPSFSPPEKNIIIVNLLGQYDWWKNKRKDPAEYRREKRLVAERVADALTRQISKLKGKIRPLDVATPVTYERYCGAYRGAWMSYCYTPEAKQMMHSGRIREIENLYLAGQWLIPPGGLAVAAVTGKWAIQRICMKENIRFDY